MVLRIGVSAQGMNPLRLSQLSVLAFARTDTDPGGDHSAILHGIDKAEARQIAAARIEELRSIPFAELASRLLDSAETDEVVGPSGVRYQLEVRALARVLDPMANVEGQAG